MRHRSSHKEQTSPSEQPRMLKSTWKHVCRAPAAARAGQPRATRACSQLLTSASAGCAGASPALPAPGAAGMKKTRRPPGRSSRAAVSSRSRAHSPGTRARLATHKPWTLAKPSRAGRARQRSRCVRDPTARARGSPLRK